MSTPRPDAVPDQLSFGGQAGAYARYRPAYPEAVFEAIARYAKVPLRHAFEIGAGTGLASRALLQRLPVALDAWEPDPALAALWSAQLADATPPARLYPDPFEQATPARADYDLGIAASVMHWLAPAATLAKVRQWLRPGGCWVMWWTVFGDPAQPDAFARASEPLYRRIAPARALPPALDAAARRRELAAAGLVDIACQRIDWSCEQTTEQVVGLAQTFPAVARQPDAARRQFLQQLAALVEDRFGGRVRRHFTTPLYLATAP